MRLIGHITGETQANLFSDYLSSLEVKSSVEPDSDNKWAIWIYSEDQVAAGKQHLADFLAHPSDPKFTVGARQGEKVQEREREAEAKLGERVFTRDTIFRSNAAVGAVTLALILICVGVFLYGGFSAANVFPKLHALFISEQFFASSLRHTAIGEYIKFLPEVQRGEVWRLITPIFVHFGVLHIVFNMLMFKDLGTMIEVRRGSWALLGMVIGFAIPSNLLQYWYNGPGFGGMSGVLYGLFGYVWMRGRWDPGSGLYLHQQTVASMLIWFVLCAVNIIPNVANAAHAGGLMAGIIWGALPLLWTRRS
jgi:GlpG protein